MLGEMLSTRVVAAAVVAAAMLTMGLVLYGVIKVEHQLNETRALGRCVLAQSALVHEADDDPVLPDADGLQRTCREWLDGERPPPPPP